MTDISDIFDGPLGASPFADIVLVIGLCYVAFVICGIIAMGR